MKKNIESKLTVTLSIEEFLKALNLEGSGDLTAVFVSQTLQQNDGFDNIQIKPSTVDLHFKPKETEI